MTGTDCGLFTHKSVPVIFEPPCILHSHFIYIYLRINSTRDFYVLYNGPIARETNLTTEGENKTTFGAFPSLGCL